MNLIKLLYKFILFFIPFCLWQILSWQIFSWSIFPNQHEVDREPITFGIIIICFAFFAFSFVIMYFANKFYKHSALIFFYSIDIIIMICTDWGYALSGSEASLIFYLIEFPTLLVLTIYPLGFWILTKTDKTHSQKSHL